MTTTTTTRRVPISSHTTREDAERAHDRLAAALVGSPAVDYTLAIEEPAGRRCFWLSVESEDNDCMVAFNCLQALLRAE